MNGKWKLRTVELPCEAYLDDLERPYDRGSALPVLTASRQKKLNMMLMHRRDVMLSCHCIERSQTWGHSNDLHHPVEKCKQVKPNYSWPGSGKTVKIQYLCKCLTHGSF